MFYPRIQLYCLEPTDWAWRKNVLPLPRPFLLLCRYNWQIGPRSPFLQSKILGRYKRTWICRIAEIGQSLLGHFSALFFLFSYRLRSFQMQPSCSDANVSKKYSLVINIKKILTKELIAEIFIKCISVNGNKNDYEL